MKSIKFRPASSKTRTPHEWSTAAELGRQQLAVATESGAAMFRGFETIRKIQEEAAHEASTRHAAAAEKLRDSRDPALIVQVQSELLHFDFASACQYWQQLAAATMEMQAEMIGCACHLIDSEAILESTAAVAAMPDLSNFFPATTPRAKANGSGALRSS